MRAHPYAEAWPLLGEDELAELAADIAANGLREPIVIHDDKILDGRNRYAACKRAGAPIVQVLFEGDDDAALAFVQSVNNARRHQSKGSLAASWALSMLAAGKRQNGRWAYGANSENSQNLTGRMRADLGVIADFAPDLLTKVRDDELNLNAAYTQAERVRDAERQALEQEERIAAEEAEALATLTEHAPAYANKVGNGFQSARVALAAWEDDNRQAAARLRREEEAKKRKAAEEEAALIDFFTRISDALGTCATYGGYADITELMAGFGPHHLKSPQEARRFDLDNLRLAANFIDMLIDWQETRHAA